MAGKSLDSPIGFTRVTWKVGWTLIDVGSLKRTAAEFTIRSTSNGPTGPSRIVRLSGPGCKQVQGSDD